MIPTKVRNHYEKAPFPDYDDFDDAASLLDKARQQGGLARMLDNDIPFGVRVLEIGCGTGQMTNFLAIANRTVVGTDFCRNSLLLADDFRKANGLKRACFCQMDLFYPAFKPETFDLVISNGVLHHTTDPEAGFETISRLVKPGGYIFVGLYHKWGRLITDIRRVIFRLTGDRLKFLDRRATTGSEAKRNAWFADQYKHPHEAKHTIPEVRGWVENTGFKYIRSIPSTVPFRQVINPFVSERYGSWFERLIVNVGMVFTGFREGGFFIVIARNVRND